MSIYKAYICVPGACPHDERFEHDKYFGCVPKDFSERTGRSKTHRQSKGADGRYRWNGGCDTAPVPQALADASASSSDDSEVRP